MAALVSDPAIAPLLLDSTVAELAAMAGLGPVSEASPLRGGGNNRVYRIIADGRPFLLKEYFHHPRDSRDRGGTEFAFVRFAWDHGIRCVPEPIAWNSQSRLALYGFVEGRKLKPEEVDASAVDSAADFYLALDSIKATPAAQTLPDASEACFSLADHLECVDRRVRRLRQVSTRGKVEAEAAAFIERELSMRWSQVKNSVSSAAPVEELHATLARRSRCLSPSDFGFHNSLRTKSGICFLDFEYAGWDDPAKTVCDFFCQLAVPVPWHFFDSFTERVSAHSTVVRKRVDLLFPVYQIKWCCIVLNHFAQVDSERRSFAGRAKLNDAEKVAQIEKARSCLSALVT